MTAAILILILNAILGAILDAILDILVECKKKRKRLFDEAKAFIGVKSTRA